MEYKDKIVTCKRGFECIKQIPAEIVETEIEAVTLSPDGESLFPECADCDLGMPDDCSMLIMPDDDGILRKVKLCMLKLWDPDKQVIE